MFFRILFTLFFKLCIIEFYKRHVFIYSIISNRNIPYFSLLSDIFDLIIFILLPHLWISNRNKNSLLPLKYFTIYDNRHKCKHLRIFKLNLYIHSTGSHITTDIVDLFDFNIILPEALNKLAQWLDVARTNRFRWVLKRLGLQSLILSTRPLISLTKTCSGNVSGVSQKVFMVFRNRPLLYIQEIRKINVLISVCLRYVYMSLLFYVLKWVYSKAMS